MYIDGWSVIMMWMPPGMRTFTSLFCDSMDIYYTPVLALSLVMASGAVDSPLANQQSQMPLIDSNAKAGSGDNYISLGWSKSSLCTLGIL